MNTTKRAAWRILSVFMVVAAVMISGCGELPMPGETKLEYITISPPSPSVGVGGSQQFTATGNYSDKTTRDLTGVAAWSSSNPSVAAIAGPGLINATAVGTTTINASAEGVSGFTQMTVTAGGTGPGTGAALQSITLNPQNPVLTVGGTVQLTATGNYADGSMLNLSTGAVAWSSSSSAVATINQDGMVSAAASGTVTITATAGLISGSTTITVTGGSPGSGPALISIALSPLNPTLNVGESVQLTATGTYTDTTTQSLASPPTIWSSSNPAVAGVGTNGMVNAVAPGTSTITASAGSGSNVTGSTTVTVTSGGPGPGPALLSIAINPPTPVVIIGGSMQLLAVGTFADSSTKNMLAPPMVWSSSNPAVATINQNGMVNGVTLGTTTITATDGAISSSVTLAVTVFTPPPDGNQGGPHNGSVSINSGAASTNATLINLNLHAEDDKSGLSYLVSENSQPPAPNDQRWHPINNQGTVFDGTFPYTLGGGYGNKTVYVWFKDSDGNISAVTSDTIYYSPNG